MEINSKVLVVDDEEVCRTDLAQILTQLGYEVTLAHDGEEALLLLLEQSDIQAVFSDIAMRKMDGLKLLRLIRAECKWWQMPVFLVSSSIDDRTKQAVRGLAVSGFITKPATRDGIAQAIAQAVLE